MLNKLKNTLSNIRDQNSQEHNPSRKRIDISVLNAEQIKVYKKTLEIFKQNIDSIDQIAKNNKTQLLSYIKLRQQQAQQKHKDTKSDAENDMGVDQKFTFQDDLKEIKEVLQQVEGQLKQFLTFEQQIKNKVHQIQQSEGVHTPNSAGIKNPQQIISKYEAEIANLKKSEENNKQILSTLGQQSQLYAKQMRDLQQKSHKLEKEIHDKNTVINNLKQQKIVLLQMRNSSTAGQLPQVEALKGKLSQFQKRLTLERTKVEQKQKQIQGLKKRMQQDRQSLQKIADELKQKQLKSKKIIDKYQRSKTQIRKFRQQKTEFIKQLNLQVARISEQLAQQKKKNQELKSEVQHMKEQIENLKTEVSKNENRKVELQSSQAELVQVRKELHEKNLQFEQQIENLKKLKDANQQLQQKRKQLLQALEKPITHEMRTLDKILRALDKLYKQYITTVFQEGNIVGFESKITYIISNVQEIKEDLQL